MTKQFTTPACVWQAPPMGWNSWDCYGASVTEAELLANARFLQEHLLPSGWDTVVCDIQWSEPAADSWDYHPFAPLTLDEYGRQLPAPGRFPSGFKAIAREIHGMGLQFGVHLMRGIPRQATHAGLPVLGTDYTAADIASRTSICFWNTDMYGVNPDHPAAQAYYDSVFALFAAWGVDYVKVDDIAWNYYAADHYCGGEVALIHRAILRSGRPMTLSLSPGPADPRQRAHLRHYANAWRITDDFWDSWPLVERCLEACVAWVGDSGAGSWPDADMLPFGRLRMRARGAAAISRPRRRSCSSSSPTSAFSSGARPAAPPFFFRSPPPLSWPGPSATPCQAGAGPCSSSTEARPPSTLILASGCSCSRLWPAGNCWTQISMSSRTPLRPSFFPKNSDNLSLSCLY